AIVLMLETILFAFLFFILVGPLSLFFFGVGIAACWLEKKLKKSVPKAINAVVFKAIAALLLLAMGFFLNLAFFEIYFWVPFLFTAFFAGFAAAGYACFKKKDIKLAAICFIGLFLALLAI
ncbi:unnamed protein product, partial [marine sediment metagenome]